jgi:prevent-host-death family protein
MLYDHEVGQEGAMTDTVNLAEAKAMLSELVRRAAGGETINIALRGRPVARIVPLETERQPLDIEAWRAVACRAGAQDEDSGELMRRMRDSDRY